MVDNFFTKFCLHNPKDIAKRLDLGPNEPAVIVRSLSYLSDTTLFQLTTSYHRPDKFKFIDFAPKARIDLAVIGDIIAVIILGWDVKWIEPDHVDIEFLVAKLKEVKIDVMLDMVLNHCSTEHEWFKRALAGEEKYQKYFW